MTTSSDHSGLAPVKISGDGPVASLVAAEMGRPAAGADLHISITEQPWEPLTGGLEVSGSRALLRHRVHVADGQIELSLSSRFGPVLYRVRLSDHPSATGANEAQVFVNASKGGWASAVTRWSTRDFASWAGMVAKNLLYEVVDPLLWCRLLSRQTTLAHAGAIERTAGGAVLLLGGGGVGKSTSVLALASLHGWRYLADDLAIVGRDGVVSRHPKHLQVYAYNVELIPELEDRLLVDRSSADLMAWTGRRRALGGKQVRRRVSAESLFGVDGVCDRADLAATAFLVASPQLDAPRLDEISVDEAARLATATMFEEEWDFLRFLNGIASLDATAPDVADLYQRTGSVLNDALSAGPVYRLSVPPRTSGRDLADLIANQLG